MTLRLQSATLLSLWALVVLSTGCQSVRPEDRTFRSPDGVFDVTFHGDFGRPKSFWSRSRVGGTVSWQHEPVADLGIIHTSNKIDESFDDQYRSSVWTTPRLLHFFHGANTLGCDVLTLRNDGPEDLAFVKLQTDDLIIALDVKKGTTLMIPIVPPYEPGAVTIKSDAQFAPGGARLTGLVTIPRQQEPARTGLQVVINGQSIQVKRERVPGTVPIATGHTCGDPHLP